MTRKIAPALAGSAGLLIGALTANNAAAGAFQLNERSAKAIGASLSGSVSAASDVTFASFNPAQLSYVESFEMGGSANLVSPISNGTFQNGPFAGLEVDADKEGYVPSLSIGYRLTDEIVVGFSSYSPFGLATSYAAGGPVSGDAITSELRTVSFSPMIAYEVLPGLSLGASFNVLYVDARLTSAALNLDGDEIDFGFTVGLHMEPFDGTKVGLTFAAGYDVTVPATHQNAILGLTAPADVSASLPSTIYLGITQDITEKLRVMGEFRYSDWSVFESIDIRTPSFAFAPPLDNLAEEQNYDDAFFVAVGAEYDVLPNLTVRGGLAWDQTPTSDEFRTPRVPDEDRVWFSVGASYAMSEHMTVDVGYSFLKAFNDPDVTLRNGPLAGSQISYEGGAHIFAVGGTLRF